MYSIVDYPISDTTQTAFSFNKDFLLLNHVTVWGKSSALGAIWVQFPTNWFTLSGSSGAGTATLTGAAPARTIGDTLRIRRITPAAKADRLVDFQDGSLSELDLDTSALQNLFIAQEVVDQLTMTIAIASDDGASWDAQSLRVKNLGAGTNATDAARLQDVWNYQVVAGNLPAVTSANENAMLAVQSGVWTVVYGTTIATIMGFGSAVFRNVGTGASNLLQTSDADLRYLQLANNLADLDDVGLARGALGLTSAATATIGTGAGNLVALDGSARLPGVDGRNLDLSANAVNQGRTGAYAEFSPVLAQTWTTNSTYTTLQLSAIVGSIYNGGGAIAVNTGTHRFTLAAGNYRIRFYFDLKNSHASNFATFNWKLRSDPAGTPVDRYTSPSFTIGDVDNSQVLHNTIVRDFYWSAAGSTTFDLQARDTSGSPGTIVVVDGQIVVEKIT